MPTWLLPVLGAFGKWLWHAICRFWSVFLVGAIIVIIFMSINGWKIKQYDIGYRKGYSQALTDHPTYVVNSGGVVNQGQKYKWLGVDFTIWKLHLGGGW